MNNIEKLKTKEKRNDPVIRRVKEIQEWYKTHNAPTGDKKLVIDKLRMEYEKEAEELDEKHRCELRPLCEEYDKKIIEWKKLLAEIKDSQKQIIDKGEPQGREHKELSRKFVELELQILRT